MLKLSVDSLATPMTTTKDYIYDYDDLNNNNNQYSATRAHRFSNFSSIQGQQHSDDELGFVGRWDSRSDKLFIFIFSILSIPANIFLIVFYATKIISYKRYNKKFAPNKLRHVYAANCFNTYLVEICSFDTIISVHLLTDTIFKQLYDYKLTIYESIFDISQFTCKFFIHALHISAAMTGWLTFLLAFNRCMLLFRLRSNRLCINTKYLTLFVFCICTVANVFRLELLHFNYNESLQHHFANYTDIISAVVTSSNPECGFNLGAIPFHFGEATNAVFWSLIAYNIIFSITPACGNLILSIYLIKRHSNLKQKIILNHINKLKKLTTTTTMTTAASTLSINNILSLNGAVAAATTGETSMNGIDKNLNLNKYIADFFHTCMPCIAISCTYVICYLPHTILETINQIIPTLFLFKARIYVVYLRYLFHGCKFYLLFLVSYKFRKEVFKFIKYKCCGKITKETSSSKQEHKQRKQQQYDADGEQYFDEENLLYKAAATTSNSTGGGDGKRNKAGAKKKLFIEARVTYL